MSATPAIPVSPYLLEEDAARYLKLAADTLKKKRMAGTGPKFRRHGRKPVYKVVDLDEWSDAQARLSTADAPGALQEAEARS